MAVPASSATDGDSRSRDSVQVAPGRGDKIVGDIAAADIAAADIAAVGADIVIPGTVAAEPAIVCIVVGTRRAVLPMEDIGSSNNLSRSRVSPNKVPPGSEDVLNS